MLHLQRGYLGPQTSICGCDICLEADGRKYEGYWNRGQLPMPICMHTLYTVVSAHAYVYHTPCFIVFTHSPPAFWFYATCLYYFYMRGLSLGGLRNCEPAII